MPTKKGKVAPAKNNKRGRPPKKAIKKTQPKPTPKKTKPVEEARSEESSDNNSAESLPAQNGNSVEAGNNSENVGTTKNESQMIAELQSELRKAEQSKRVLYNALVRERSLNNDKPSVASAASKTGHNFCKAYSALSGDQKKDRIRLLASVVAEFADPKNNSSNKAMEVKFVVEALSAHWKSTPTDFQ